MRVPILPPEWSALLRILIAALLTIGMSAPPAQCIASRDGPCKNVRGKLPRQHAVLRAAVEFPPSEKRFPGRSFETASRSDSPGDSHADNRDPHSSLLALSGRPAFL